MNDVLTQRGFVYNEDLEDDDYEVEAEEIDNGHTYCCEYAQEDQRVEYRRGQGYR